MLSRWSRLKAESKKSGVALPVEIDQARPAAQVAVPVSTSEADSLPVEESPQEPLPSVHDLTPESDFTPFMRAGVDPVQRNAALKKLFADPHYNVMDGLDIYISDYGKPDPIPPEMLRGLVQSQLLGLFKDEEEKEDVLEAGETEQKEVQAVSQLSQSEDKLENDNEPPTLNRVNPDSETSSG
jgi:Protein of unknown function (DUF3306)